MASLSSVGGAADDSINFQQQVDTSPPVDGQTTYQSLGPPFLSPLLSGIRIKTKSQGATSSSTRATSIDLPGSTNLANEIMNVETNAQIRALFRKIARQNPATRQVGALVQFTQRISDINLLERLRVLRTICDTAVSLGERGVDCSPIFRHIPRAAKSLLAARLLNGYLIAATVIPAGMAYPKFDATAENYGEYFSGIADLLIELSDCYGLSEPGRKPLAPMVAGEVHFIFDELAKLPAYYCMNATIRLALNRFHLPTDAADAVTRRALEAIKSTRFTDDQCILICRALVLGLLGIPDADTDGFDIEFFELREALQNPALSLPIDVSIELAKLLGRRARRAAWNEKGRERRPTRLWSDRQLFARSTDSSRRRM